MKAIRVSEYGGPSVLKLEEVPAMLEAPVAAIKSYVASGEAFPVTTYDLIRKVFDAVIDEPSLWSRSNKRTMRSNAGFGP